MADCVHLQRGMIARTCRLPATAPVVRGLEPHPAVHCQAPAPPRPTLGCQPSSVLALVMSGLRRDGSSAVFSTNTSCGAGKRSSNNSVCTLRQGECCAISAAGKHGQRDSLASLSLIAAQHGTPGSPHLRLGVDHLLDHLRQLNHRELACRTGRGGRACKLMRGAQRIDCSTSSSQGELACKAQGGKNRASAGAHMRVLRSH